MEKEKKSPFEKYSGIGNPGIGTGRRPSNVGCERCEMEWMRSH